MYKLELTEEEHEFLKSCMDGILSTDWYASAEEMEMAEAMQEKLLALPKRMPVVKPVEEQKGMAYAKLPTLAKTFNISANQFLEVLSDLCSTHEILVLEMGRMQFVNVRDFHRALLERCKERNVFEKRALEAEARLKEMEGYVRRTRRAMVETEAQLVDTERLCRAQRRAKVRMVLLTCVLFVGCVVMTFFML